MNTTDNPTTCANCGKGEESESVALKNCVACKMVKYCSRDCQKAHRSQHKKECRERAAELHDESLFKQPPLPEDCPICFLRLPSMNTGRRHNSCCGKVICGGCICAGAIDQLCPFCRAPAPSSEEEVMERAKKRIEVGDANTIHDFGCYYADGIRGLPRDQAKALELWHRAGELGSAESYYNIGCAHMDGEGVERNEKKATHYWELAAMGGNASARHNLGILQTKAGNMNRALKHFMIAVGGGENAPLKFLKQLYLDGRATKDDYAKALKVYQAYICEIKSDDRDKATAYSDEYNHYKYYE